METDSEAEYLSNNNSVNSKKASFENSECDDSQYSSLACMRVFHHLPSSGDGCNYRHEFDCGEDKTSNGKHDQPDCYYEFDHGIREPEPCFSNEFYMVAAKNEEEDDYSARRQSPYQDSAIARIPPEDETCWFPAFDENPDSGFNSHASEMSYENADIFEHIDSTYSDTVGYSFGANNNSGSKCEYFVNGSNNVASENNFLNPNTRNYGTSQFAPSSTFSPHDTPWRLRGEDDYQDSEGYQRGDDYNQEVLGEWRLAGTANTDASSSNFSIERASTTSSGYFSMPFIPQYSLARRASFAGRDLPRLVSSTDSSTAGDDQFFANNFPERSAGYLSSTDSSSLNSLISQFGASRINSLENLSTRFEPSETTNFGWRNGWRKALLTSSSESVYGSDDQEFCRGEYSRYKRRRLVQKQKELQQFQEEFPNEILVQILKYLSIRECVRQERVCKQWQQLVQLVLRHKKVISFESIFGRDSESRCTPITFTNAALCSVLSRCGDRARVLSLEAFRGVITFEPKTLPTNVSRYLVSVNFSDIQLNQDALIWISSHCSCLIDVNLHNCFQKDFDVSWETFFPCCPSLQRIDICGSLTNRNDYDCLAKLPIGARFLNLGEIRLARAAVSNLFQTTFLVLTTLIFGFNDFHYESCIQPLMKFLSRIESLSTLRVNMQLTINERREYQDLDFSRLRNLTDLVFTGAHLTTKTMRSIAQHCPKLTLLDLSGDYSVESTEGFKEIAKMSRLTCLKISSSSADDEVVECIASGPVGRSLRFLSLRMDNRLTDYGVAAVLRNCKGLVSLDLSHDKRVTDASVTALVDYVKQRSAKQETLEKLTVKHLDSFLRDRVVINIPIAERCYHALAASVRNWNLTPFIDFREYCAKGKKDTAALKLHAWLGRTGITRPHRNSHELLEMHDNNLDQAPYFRLSHRDYRWTSPTYF